MLQVTCKACGGSNDFRVYDSEGNFVKWSSCEHCINGYVDAEPEKKVYVNVYRITRHFGGHEEGGWYYNWDECLESIPCRNKFSDEIVEDMEKQYEGMKHGNIYSVLGGTDIDVRIEEKPAESQTRERPYYE